jgi:peptidoglycan/xylan/chitin deacetylase (PgdA/CDA1 family)
MSVGSLLLATGLDRGLRWVAGGEGVVLAFHRLRPPAGPGQWSYLDGLTITPQELAATLALLRREGYRLRPLADLANPDLRHRRERFACLTFDDGYRDNLTELVPVLEATEAHATVFIASGFIDRTARLWWDDLETALAAGQAFAFDGPHGPERHEVATPTEKSAVAWQFVRRLLALPAAEATALMVAIERAYGIDPVATVEAAMLTQAELATLATHPLVTIGAHTVDHHPLTSLDATAAARTIADGRARVAALIGVPVTQFAYPFGSAETFSQRDVDLVASAGFDLAVTSLPGPVRRGDTIHRLPRVPVSGHNGGERLRLALTGVRRPGR